METTREKVKNLRRVPLRYLWDGMVLSDDLYNENGKVLLIRAGERVSAKTLERLENLGTEDSCVMTCEECYREIMMSDQMPPEVRQRVAEDEFGYTSLKKEVKHLLGMIAHAADTDYQEAYEVTGEIMEKIREMEFPDFFRCINVPRTIDEDLQRHLLNIAFLNGMMGYWLELPEKEIQQLVLAGLLHDIGKTKIPEEILYAPRKLTVEEFKVIKMHPVYSYELLGNQIEEPVQEAVLHHHERMDGSGYPDGYRDGKVSKFSRITAICDVYDAMVSKRIYKDERLPLDVLERMRDSAFDGLDADYVHVFVRNMAKRFRESRVQMSDGADGVIAYIPPNDIDHPIVMTGDTVRQVDETWYCKRIYSEIVPAERQN